MNTASANPINQRQDVVWLLQGLTEETPSVRASVLLSSDGIVKAAHGLDRDASAQLAAMSAGLFSMVRNAGVQFDDSDAVGQVVAELDSSQLYVSWAGSNSVLVVLAQKEADPAVIGYQMAQLIKAVRPFLDTSARSTARPTVDLPGANHPRSTSYADD